MRRYQVLDTPPDHVFDDLAALAARSLQAPMAVVSIVDRDRIWFKARHGVEVAEITRDPGLCSSAILAEGTWVVTDAASDPRTLANPLVVGDPGLRFYAGHPLTTHDGFNLGTICVLDRQPRDLTPHQTNVLRDLAALVVHQLELRLRTHQLVTAYETRLQEVQHLADALQRSLLPPSMPLVRYLNIAASYNPASKYEVGGDFYDVFPVDPRSWGLVIGDVCGKGATAASQTSGARYSLRAAAIQQPAPAAALEVVNQTLLRDTGSAHEVPFVTALFARITARPDGAEVVLATAGHPGPLILRASGEVESVGVPGTLLGVFDDIEVTETSVELAADDLVVFFTDGLTDSGSKRLEQEGLVAILRGCTGLSPQAVVDRLLTAVESAQRDDIAIVAIRCDAVA
ncbi:MAG TPA: GAF domain-containing SpoIIE family protein phosphatase [Nocardioidaceae bacterium]|nr:GAF domain-containing SpoIIE family protein phosphatase [Nocardioidaceae bacterium]